MEYERNQILCEAQEARIREEQKRQTILAQYRRFCEWEADQEAAGRILDDSSSDI